MLNLSDRSLGGGGRESWLDERLRNYAAAVGVGCVAAAIVQALLLALRW